MTSVLFLCTRNSCRPQMAEGWTRLMGAFSRVDSAGIEVRGLNSRAVTVKGIVITSQESSQVNRVRS